MVLLIGNYVLDRQQSMQRFSAMMLEGLSAAGVEAKLIQPEPIFGRIRMLGRFAAKWLAYLDKFVLFPRQLRRELQAKPSLVHICDHSNAMYARQISTAPTVVTCHDLLAVRGALGEETDCPALWTGRLLQRWIVRGLRCANVIACVSEATLEDARRLIPQNNSEPKLELVPNGLNYPYRQLARAEAEARLKQISALDLRKPFFLHVGSNLRRKNREGVLRIFALTKDQHQGQLVLAGDPPTAELHSLGKELGISARMVAVPNPDSPMLEALYTCATALLFPSRFEGFGWPIIEAQACGCPVLGSTAGPLPEVAGDAGLLHQLDDETGFARDLLRLLDPQERAKWSAKSLVNAQRFTAEKMIERYLEIYRAIPAQP